MPRDKARAIAALGSGVLNKCFLRFPRAFWDPEVELFGWVSEQRGRWAEFLNLQAYGDAPVLLGFNAASFGREIEGWEDRAVVASAMETLRLIHGAKIPEPEAWQITRWASDRFARGAYSFAAVGSGTRHRQALAEPVEERLFFAGEATHTDYPATVHGALLSGEREAERILDL